MFDQDILIKLAEIFKCLSDPTRLKIIKSLLDGEKNVSKICEEIEMEQSATSHQLKKLKTLKLVKAKKIGREVFYSLDDDHVVGLLTAGLDHVVHD
ncbi:MAG: metalloregulator ArsR/SmtB family transcription factor [Bacillota bacterium]|nr:metalloregulator ArsR/SmtB family transcription factor [Bacillota bacterium]